MSLALFVLVLHNAYAIAAGKAHSFAVHERKQ